MIRIAIVTTHPIQYYAPWFRHLAQREEIALKVFYLWDAGVTVRKDPGFGFEYKWDIPLLNGYEHMFVSNVSARPGTDHFWGLRNPALTTHLKDFRPDAVLMLGYNYATFFKLMFCWKSSPLLLKGDSHRLKPKGGVPELLRRRIIAALFRRIKAFLYVGKANRDYFKMQGIPEERLFFSPHAVDGQRFRNSDESAQLAGKAWRKKLGIPEENRVILFVGKLEPKKGPFDLLSAFKRLEKDDLSLVYVGTGELQDRLKLESKSCKNVFFAGFNNQSEMPGVYALADLLVLPSTGSDETWGMCVHEAMTIGKPIIVSDLVGCGPDLVRAHENGLVFKAGNTIDLADKLRQAFANSPQLVEWGRTSQTIIQNYTFSQATEGLLKAVKYATAQ